MALSHIYLILRKFKSWRNYLLLLWRTKLQKFSKCISQLAEENLLWKKREMPFIPNDSISAFSTPHLTCGLYFKQVKKKGWPTHRSRHFSPLEHHVFSYPSVGVHIDTFILVAHQHLHPIRLGQDDNGVRSNIALNLQVKRTLRVRITLNGERGRGEGAEHCREKAQTN